MGHNPKVRRDQKAQIAPHTVDTEVPGRSEGPGRSPAGERNPPPPRPGAGNAGHGAQKAKDAIDFIHGAQLYSKKAGLRNMRCLLSALRIAPDALPFVHIAGTNGKGSTCAMIESVLRAAGYRTGLYTSPYLQGYNERMRLDGVPVSDEALVAAVDKVRPVVEALRGEDIHCTVFEIGTAVAMRIFLDAGVQIAVMEVGVGGIYDPTNVILPRICAITNIGLDHTRVLGETLPEIAQNKAGIAKRGVPMILHPATDEVYAVVRDTCAQVGAPLIRLLTEQVRIASADARGQMLDFALPGHVLSGVSLPLPGAHQAYNALTAFAVLNGLSGMGYDLPETALRQGFAGVRWPGRLEWWPGAPPLLLDGAHNEQGLAALLQYVRTYLKDRRVLLLCGVLADKATSPMLDALSALSDTAVCTQTDEPRALPASELAVLLWGRGVHTSFESDPGLALRAAKAAAGENGVVLCTGSLHFVGLLRTLLEGGA